MREIKYRAFDKIGEPLNQMAYSDNLEGGLTELFEGWEGFNDVELMQYTGLKGWGDREIYEGDILSQRWLVKVYMGKNGAWMVKFGLNQKINKTRLLSKYLKDRVRAGTPHECNVVIGNIYEHPELIEAI